MSQTGEITSLANAQVKYVNALQNKASFRKKEGVFVVEGAKIFLETPEEYIKNIFISSSALEELNSNKGFSQEIKEKILVKLDKLPYIKISDDVAKHISDTVTTQGIFIVVKQMNYKLKELINIEEKQTFLVLDEIKDPGNMGTIIRTAEGAGVSAIVMNKECVDVYNPKVTRSTMGSIFRVPFTIEENLLSAINELKQNGVVTYVAHLNGNDFYSEEVMTGSSAIYIGNEAKGLSDEVSATADKLIRIPMEGKLESLNASVAAAILMYEAKRKRDL